MAAISPTSGPRRRDTRGVGRRRRVVLVAALVIGVIALGDALFGDRGLLALVRVQRQTATLEAEVAKAEAENHKLAEHNRRLQEDPGAIEELARRELGLIKPGEKVFILRDVPSPTPAR